MGTSPSAAADGTSPSGDPQHVSVVVPTRDRPEFARRAVLSALGQSGVVVDLVVVVDDGGRESLCDQLRVVDPRVLVVRHETSKGVSAARNRGIAESISPWIAFLDDDDIWVSDKLQRQIDAAIAGGNEWCISGSLVLDTNDVVTEVRNCPADTSAVLAGLCSHNAVPGGGSGVVVARSLLEDVGGFDESLSMVADWELWHRFAHSSGCAIVSDALVGYLQHRLSMTSTFADHDAEIARLERATMRYCDADPAVRRLVYLDWMVGRTALVNRSKAAGMKLRFAIEQRSWGSLLMAARIFLVPTDFSIRSLFRVFRSPAAGIATPAWVRAQIQTPAQPSRAARADPLRPRVATRLNVGPAPLDRVEPDPSGTLQS